MIRKRARHLLYVPIVVFLILGFVTVSNGLPTVGGEVDYFSNATYTVQVGYKIWNCGVPTHSGTVTSYWQMIDAFSCETPPLQYCYYDTFYKTIACSNCPGGC